MHKKCELCGQEIENKHSASLRHRIYCSPACQAASRRGTTLSPEMRAKLSAGRKASPKCKGPNLYNWKGGKATFAARMRIHRHSRISKQKLEMDMAFISALRIAQVNRCFYCKRILGRFAAIEHLTPLSRNGDNQNFNLVWSCRPCNSKKRSKTLEEFAIATGNLHWIDQWDAVFSIALGLYERNTTDHLSKTVRAITARHKPAPDQR